MISSLVAGTNFGTVLIWAIVIGAFLKFIAAIKFGAIMLLAILLTPSLTELALGFVPRIPEGGFINAMAIIGGVGGTYTLATYTYWVRERGWRQASWIPTMRTDAAVGYILTGLFMISMLVIGSEFLFGKGTSIEDESGLVALADSIQDRFGVVVRWVFLIGFWAVATGAMIRAWNGAAYLFADSMRTFRDVPDERAEEYLSEKSIWSNILLAISVIPFVVVGVQGVLGAI